MDSVRTEFAIIRTFLLHDVARGVGPAAHRLIKQIAVIGWDEAHYKYSVSQPRLLQTS